MPVNLEWLELTKEEVLEPELPICDPHHHLWDNPQSRYLLDELLEDTNSGHNVQETVFVECSSMYRKEGLHAMKPVGETEFVQGIAAQSASGQYGPTTVAAGIVSFADLLLGSQVASVLEAHMAASPNRLRGIRHSCSWDESPAIRVSHSNPPHQLYLNSKFREGFAALQQYNLTFDAWLFHSQIPELVSLARAFPKTTIICDHFAGPLGIGPYADKREEVFQQWKKGMKELATCPNVVVKLGGLVMTINGFGFHKCDKPPTSDELVAATSPYYMFTIEQFGPNRCMFESNFPVDKVSCSYAVLWNSFKKLTQDFSAEERAALFRGTALRVYRLSKTVKQ